VGRATYVGDSDGSDDGREQIDEDNESHGEAAEPAELLDEDELGQVVNGRVDPSTTLGQENAPLVGCDSLGEGGSDEGGLVSGEVFEKKRCKVSIFSKVQQVLEAEKERSVKKWSVLG
jgi:hypothetical protein